MHPERASKFVLVHVFDRVSLFLSKEYLHVFHSPFKMSTLPAKVELEGGPNVDNVELAEQHYSAEKYDFEVPDGGLKAWTTIAGSSVLLLSTYFVA